MLKALAGLRAAHAPLRYGRYYFRQVSGNGFDFGWPMDKCGVFAFSRVHSDVEVLVVAYPNPAQGWKGWVDVDADFAATGRPWKIAFSSLARSGTCLAKFLSPTHAAVEVSLDSNELVVLVPS